ncbi:MAG: MBL fold metallo-hydrolase [Desulfosporosinus sp.]|nr:MBL fold metallo-hydrolase [Desulfosporosinus sp.]
MQVSNHVHALRIPFTITTNMGVLDRFVYAFVIIHGSQICLIDTGVASSQQLIFDYIRQIGRKPEEIATIILTHSHPDHIGSVRSIKQITGCKVIAHSGEKEWIENVDKQFTDRPVPGFNSLVGGSVTIDRIVDEGEFIDLGDDLQLRVIHTPGHSKGSISLYAETDQVLFVGDVVPIPGDMPIYDDPLISIESIKKLKAYNKVNVLLSAWDEPKTASSIDKVLQDGVEYIQRLHNTVIEVVMAATSMEAVDICKRVLESLNLPLFMANPLVARSFIASLRYMEDVNRPK